MYSTMLEIADNARFHYRERIKACYKCGETAYHESMRPNEKRRRQLLDVEFLRNHQECEGKMCINCNQKFSNIANFNHHLNNCNYVFNLEATADNEPDVDFNFTRFKKFITKDKKNWKKLARELNMKTGMCFTCCKSPCKSPCLPLLCPTCNNRYNFYHYIDHFSICSRIHRISPFYYFKLCQTTNRSDVLTSDIIQQLELITISSDPVSSDSSQPAVKVPRIRLKTRKNVPPRGTPHDTSKFAEAQNEDTNIKAPNIDKTDANDENQFYKGTKIADSDFSNAETDQPSSSEFETKSNQPWAKYKRKSRERNYANEIRSLIEEIPIENRSEALLKNNLVSLKAVNSNILLYGPNEFLKRKFHFLCMDHKWTDLELGWYANSFNLRKKYLKDILAAEKLSAIQHRSTFNQQYRQDRIDQILEFILSNSAPAADYSRSIIRKKTTQVHNRTKHAFYR